MTVFGQDLSDTCGELAVKFVTVSEGEEVDFIDVDQSTGVLALTPTLSHDADVYGLQMQVYLADYPNVIAQQAFIATIGVTENCKYDQITFRNNIGAATYTFSTPENILFVDPEVTHSVANCPHTCKHYANTAEITLPSPFVRNVDAQTGAVNFASSNSHLDGSAFPMLIVCESLESELS